MYTEGGSVNSSQIIPIANDVIDDSNLVSNGSFDDDIEQVSNISILEYCIVRLIDNHMCNLLANPCYGLKFILFYQFLHKFGVDELFT